MKGKLLRRHFATWAIGALPGASVRAQSPAVAPLKVLAWPGYADADIVAEFEERTRSRVEITTVATHDQLRAHVDAQGSAGFDVLAANTAEIARYAAASRLARIDLTRVPRAARQLPRFRDNASIPGLTRQGTLLALPYTFAEMGLIFDRRQLSRPPASITSMWDPNFGARCSPTTGAHTTFPWQRRRWSCRRFASRPMRSLLGIAGATAVRVGRAIGAREDGGPRTAGLVGIGLVLVYMVFCALTFLALPRTLASLFTKDEQVLATAVSLIRVASFFQLADGLQGVAGGALRGAADTKFASWANVVCHWLIGLPLAILFGFVLHYGAVGFWWGLLTGLFVVAAVLVLRFRKVTRGRIAAL